METTRNFTFDFMKIEPGSYEIKCLNVFFEKVRHQIRRKDQIFF